MRPGSYNEPGGYSALQRIRVWYGVLIVIACILVVRLFYLQIIRHDHYSKAATKSQFKEYQIQPERGAILAHDGTALVPVVLNEKRYTLFADPQYIKDPEKSARAVHSLIGGNYDDYVKQLRQEETRYVVLAKKLPRNQKEKIDKAAEQEQKDLKGVRSPTFAWRGIGTREAETRTYPQGQLAANVLGFVNDDGEGKYGIEQALDNDLKGQPGELKAITDAQGVPLVANKDNVMKAPVPGKRVALTVDVSMQKQLEDILKSGLDRAKAKSGSAAVIDPRTGAVKAMASYPTYNPAEFYKVEDPTAFTNLAINSAIEVGSVMKPLTLAAALNTGAVRPDTTYFDPGFVVVGDAKITNVEEVSGSATRSMGDILKFSLNTGATYLLKQMGGGEINRKARNTWHDYMVNHYYLGQKTGIEQGFESEGYIPDPNNGNGLNIQYANTAFGQGMTATPLQMAAAMASVVNGGTYYKPYIVAGSINDNGDLQKREPTVLKRGVVSPDVGATVRQFMEGVVKYGNKAALRDRYSVGSKSGTAQIARPEGGYYPDKYNGMQLGFVGGDEVQYVIVVRVNEPGIPGYAGSVAAAPIFAGISNMLIDNFGVTPKS